MEEKGGEDMNGESLKEKALVRHLKELFEREPPTFLKKIYAHVNLSTKKFREIWSQWWQGEAPPRLEVDMVPLFELREDVLLCGVEVEFFRNESKNFTDGLQQAISFGLFGFDSLVLWHIFSETMKNSEIDGYARPMREIVEGLDLPIVYFATKLSENNRFEFFAPSNYYSSTMVEPSFLLKRMKDECEKKKNPLLKNQRVLNARKTLKIILKIPV